LGIEFPRRLLDREVAAEFADTLRDLGIAEVFAFSEKDYLSDFEEAIHANLGRADFVLALVSRASLKSSWVHHEINIARELDKETWPVVVEPGVQLHPTFAASLNYLSIRPGAIQRDEVVRFLLDAGIAADGTVPRRFIEKYPTRMADEVFAIEMLNQPIRLRRDGRNTALQVNRRGVNTCLISNRGKGTMITRYVDPHREELTALDERLQWFLAGTYDDNPLDGFKHPLPLRWASGGILSVVHFEGRRWVPLFFRDIPPVGWNVSLGASERALPREGAGGEVGFASEHANVAQLLLREFLEETLVLDRDPGQNPHGLWRPFYLDFFGDPRGETLARRFNDTHLHLRRDADGLVIQESPETIDLHLVGRTGMHVEVYPGRRLSNVIVAISLLDLGIEVVKVLEYDLKSEDCLVDGEILEVDGNLELVRMPFALLSLEYLERNSRGAAPR